MECYSSIKCRVDSIPAKDDVVIMMLPTIQVVDDVVSRSDRYDMDNCKDGRCKTILYGEEGFGSSRRERVLEFCMPLYLKKQEARHLHFRT